MYSLSSILHKLIRCNNPTVHTGRDRFPGEGNILCFVRDNSIYIQCNNHHCYRWTKLTFDLPGQKIDLSQAAITQELMPKRHHFENERAPTLIEG